MENVALKREQIDNPWEDLVVSILAVNRWSLEKTYLISDGLRSQGLFDPKTLASLEHEEAIARLKKAGFNRGTFMTNLFALRLTSLGQLIETIGVEPCTNAILRTTRRELEETLRTVSGIGPTVLANFCALRGNIDMR
jgi:hypothetical protein